MNLKNTIAEIVKTIKHRSVFFYLKNKAGMCDGMADDLYLSNMFRLRMGKKLDLVHPMTYNEKLQWLKLNDRKKVYNIMVDKYLVKNYVAKLIGGEYIIPTLGLYNRFDEIDFNCLPDRFVLKCTHDSGGLVICKNKKDFDIARAAKLINRSLNNNYFLRGREWPYKDLEPKIIAEKYMEDSKGSDELTDYKFFCFNGKVKMMFVATDRQKENEETKFDFFDENFNHLPFIQGHPNSKKELSRPVNFEKMKNLAEKLSSNVPHLRVDFYEIDGKVYFGELTFFHFNGMQPIVPEEWDYKIGEWLALPDKKCN